MLMLLECVRAAAQQRYADLIAAEQDVVICPLPPMIKLRSARIGLDRVRTIGVNVFDVFPGQTKCFLLVVVLDAATVATLVPVETVSVVQFSLTFATYAEALALADVFQAHFPNAALYCYVNGVAVDPYQYLLNDALL